MQSVRDVFRAYVEQMLAPALLPGDVVVMDNLAAHKSLPSRKRYGMHTSRRVHPSAIALKYCKPRQKVMGPGALEEG